MTNDELLAADPSTLDDDQRRKRANLQRERARAVRPTLLWVDPEVAERFVQMREAAGLSTSELLLRLMDLADAEAKKKGRK